MSSSMSLLYFSQWSERRREIRKRYLWKSACHFLGRWQGFSRFFALGLVSVESSAALALFRCLTALSLAFPSAVKSYLCGASPCIQLCACAHMPLYTFLGREPSTLISQVRRCLSWLWFCFSAWYPPPESKVFGLIFLGVSVCLPLLGCFHPVPLVSLGGLFVSRGVSEPWKNEEWNTCYVCWHRSRRVILFLVLALLCPSPGHQLPLGVVLSSRVPYMVTEQGEVMKVSLLVKVGWAGPCGVAELWVLRNQCFPPAFCRVLLQLARLFCFP